jgi:hypothetical protein
VAHTVMFVADFGSLTGLTLNAKLYDDAGAQVGSDITSGIVEIGDGIYTYKHTSVPDDHYGCFVMYKSTDATIKVALSVSPIEGELTALADALIRRGRSHSDGSAETGSLYELIGESTQSATSGTTLTTYETDGTTVFNTRTLTLDPNAQPVAAIA